MNLNSVSQTKESVTSSLVTDGLATKTEADWVSLKLDQFGILLCGTARVGKSTLINAICGQEVCKTSAKLDSCTQEVQKYSVTLEYNEKNQKAQTIVNFWDSPGIEDWTETSVKKYVLELMNNSNPICMLYCASPGTLAKTETVRWFCEACHGSGIFFALVCTNKFAGTKDQREACQKQFKEILAEVAGKQPYLDEPNKIWRCHKVGMVAEVNSVPFDNELGHADPQGVNELCYVMMEELDKEKLKGWCITLLKNRSFWQTMGHKIKKFLPK